MKLSTHVITKRIEVIIFRKILLDWLCTFTPGRTGIGVSVQSMPVIVFNYLGILNHRNSTLLVMCLFIPLY